MSCGVFYNIESNIADNKFLVGFLFRDPMFKKEDKVDFCINGKRFDTITITDLNKIYKPIHAMLHATLVQSIDADVVGQAQML